MLPQPDDTTCGPTCLQAIYKYYNDVVPLVNVIKEVPSLESGGTLLAFLATHALKRNYKATIYTYNINIFDPTWFQGEKVDIKEKLKEQMIYKKDLRFQLASKAFIEFINAGGEVKFQDLTSKLIRSYLRKNIPILTGLSSTFLYREMRIFGESEDHDILGTPSGHFVVLCGYDPLNNDVLLADPMSPIPYAKEQKYMIHIEHLICSILLGVLTDDANFLILEPIKRKNH